MKIQELEERFTIKPELEIDPNFELEKEFEKSLLRKGADCYNCGACKENTYWYPSAPWSSTITCVMCKRIIVVYWSDAMSGNSKDTVRVFKEKNEIA